MFPKTDQSPSDHEDQLPVIRNLADIGPLLTALRRNAGLTQEGVSGKIPLSVRFLADVEHNRKPPSIRTLLAMVHAVRHEVCILPADFVAQLLLTQNRVKGLAAELAALEKSLRPEGQHKPE